MLSALLQAELEREMQLLPAMTGRITSNASHLDPCRESAGKVPVSSRLSSLQERARFGALEVVRI